MRNRSFSCAALSGVLAVAAATAQTGLGDERAYLSFLFEDDGPVPVWDGPWRDFTLPQATSKVPADQWGDYSAASALDGNLATSWAEGAAGPGIGEKIAFPLAVGTQVIRVLPGYGVDGTFQRNHRVKRALLTVHGIVQTPSMPFDRMNYGGLKFRKEVTFADRMELQQIDLGQALQSALPGEQLVGILEILEVYRGNRYDDTCIAEIQSGPFVFVEGGTFRMGDAAGDSGFQPVHSVTVSGFYLGKYEVTQKEWIEVMGANPSFFKGDTRPVENVSWFEAVDFCNRLSTREGLDPCYTIRGVSVTCDFSRNGYRLPTEAEWEYAAKGGRSSREFPYVGGNDPAEVGWHGSNSGGTTHPVGGKKPNELGLYDMSGNVREWCWDWYGSFSADAQTDPRGPSSGTSRLVRGNHCATGDSALPFLDRFGHGPDRRNMYLGDLGFRLARSP